MRTSSSTSASTSPRPARRASGAHQRGGFLPEQPERRAFESVLARVVATAGVVGVGTVLGAILVAADVAGWITGLVVSVVAVALAAMLWRSRRL